MASSTFHTYPDLVHVGGRLACTEWNHRFTAAELVAGSLRLDPERIVLRVNDSKTTYWGFAPGGIGV